MAGQRYIDTYVSCWPIVLNTKFIQTLFEFYATISKQLTFEDIETFPETIKALWPYLKYFRVQLGSCSQSDSPGFSSAC